MEGENLVLQCQTEYVHRMVDNPEVGNLVHETISAMMGHPVRVIIRVGQGGNTSGGMSQLMQNAKKLNNITVK